MAITLEQAKVGMADKVDQQVVDMFRSAGIEPVLSPRVTKIVENTDDPKKWK